MASCRNAFNISFLSKKLLAIGFRSYSAQNHYELVYKFSYARVGSTVNKIKLQQTFLSALVIPLGTVLEFQNIVPPSTGSICLLIGIATNAAFYGIGQLFSKLIGRIYLDEERKLVKFSYVGFFGKRIDAEVPFDDIEWDADQSGLLYSKIRLRNSSQVLKLQEKYNDYCDNEALRKIFGESFRRT